MALKNRVDVFWSTDHFVRALGQDAINAKFINGRPNAKTNRANLDRLLNYGLDGFAFITGEVAGVFMDRLSSSIITETHELEHSGHPDIAKSRSRAPDH